MLINPSNGAEPRYYTDAYLQVNEVVKGSPALNGAGALQVRYCGGSGQRMATIDDLAPSFSEGSKYLLFCTAPPMDRITTPKAASTMR